MHLKKHKIYYFCYFLILYNVLLFIVYQFIVGKVEANLQEAAQAGGQCDPKVEAVGFVVGDVFSFLSPDKSGQEHMSGVDLAHCKSIDKQI